MDPRIIDLYNEELLYLRTEAAEFAREFPDRAARLSVSESRVEDPYVERLLEGVAYLSARVRLKIEAQYPNFTQQLLDVLFPGWLAPSPSAAVFRFDIDPADSKRLQEGVVIPRGAQLMGSLRGNAAVRCDFCTARELRLWPLQIAEVQYLAARAEVPAAARVAGGRAASSLRLELVTVGEGDLGQMPLDALPLFIAQSDAYGAQLMELLAGRCVAVSVGADAGGRGALHWLPRGAVRQIGFDADEALFPIPHRGHAGFRVLREYAALPEKFRFVEVSGLRAALPAKAGRRLVLTFYFDGTFPRLESAIKTPSLALFCVPAVNLRERPLERVDIEPGRTEFHLIGDRTRPTESEVVQLLDVRGGGPGGERRFAPIFETVSVGRLGAGSFYTVRRERRMLSQSETVGRPVTYPGSEVYIALCEPQTPPFGKDLQYLSVRALCSNRDLPLYLRRQFADAQFELSEAAPVAAIACVAGPSEPLASPVDGFDPWVALSHLFVNYLSLVDAGKERGADVLRAMLGLYAAVPGHLLLRQSEGLLEVATQQITRRVPGGGPLAFGRGVQISLTMNDRAFDGGSPFLLASVLEHFLAAHVAINSFVETRLVLSDRAEQITWPTRFGRRPTF